MDGTDPSAGHDAVTPHASPPLAEAARLMNICNSCRYCEGLCAVFPAMEMRRTFPDGDLNYLANLCHNCGACYYDCQFSPPHEFQVNVPETLAKVRTDSYARYAWPGPLRGLFNKNGLWVTLIASLSTAGFLTGFMAWVDPDTLFGVHSGPGAFYKLMPHNTMVAIFGSVFAFSILALVMGLRNFLADIGPTAKGDLHGSLWQAVHDAGRLRYLDGGGAGCVNDDEKPADSRRLYHHMTFYGFMLCFAATSVATLYHYLFDRIAPYPWWDLPVVFGAIGGIGLIIGPIGLLKAKWARHPDTPDEDRFGMDAAFLVMLFLTAATGLALLFLRETSVMGVLLAVHLGVVLGLFLTMPYGKFVHGIYRFAALVRHARERQ